MPFLLFFWLCNLIHAHVGSVHYWKLGVYSASRLGERIIRRIEELFNLIDTLSLRLNGRIALRHIIFTALGHAVKVGRGVVELNLRAYLRHIILAHERLLSELSCRDEIVYWMLIWRVKFCLRLYGQL